MRLTGWKSITLILVLFVTTFIVSGYVLSDDSFFSELIHKNRISTPEEAFAFVGDNTYRPTGNVKVAALTTPRNMLTRQKYLSCDQGAIVLATMVHKLGYETRLVDLLGDDGISHHTILEVNQNGTWKTYDTLQKLQGVTYQQSVRSLNANSYTRNLQPVYRPYPRVYNWFIQNNFYLKHLALLLRGLPG